MVEEEKKEETKKPVKKTRKPKGVDINVEKYPITELLEKNKIKPLNAVGFLNYYNLTEEFKLAFETGECNIKFSEGEFNDMYERYNQREI